VFLASHINALTLVVWEALLRWAHYLASTWHYKLTYRFVDEPGARVLVASADSSLGNAHDGTSWGGRVLGFAGHETGRTGALSLSTKKFRETGDSSAAVELLAIGAAAKDLAATRISYAEIGKLGELGGPSPISVDASAVILGTPSEKVSWNMRYSAIRYALLRTLTESEVVRLVKVDTADMVADGCTKPLEGTAFARFRDYVLGVPEPAAAGPAAS
jgi:hypothetical protein